MIFSKRKKTSKAAEDNEEFERCVLCHTLTDVRRSTPIEKREYYVVGIGQLCQSCSKKVHKVNWNRINR